MVAGATDLYPLDAVRRASWDVRVGRELPLLDVSRLPELREIRLSPSGLRLGAAVTFSEIAEAGLPDWCRALVQAAREVGGRQIQNRATIGGNLCNASPAADSAPPLLALEAEVELASVAGRRRLALSRFLLGNRKTALLPGELLVAIDIPHPGPGTRSLFSKLGARRHLVISIVSLAVALRLEASGRIGRVRLAVGACAPTAVRLKTLEEELSGLDVRTAEARIAPARLVELAPIDDVRASAAYRLEATAELLRRALRELAAVARCAGGSDR